MKQPEATPFSFSHLENYIALHQVLTGNKPKIIVLLPQVYDLFIQEAQRHAETLGLNPGFKDDKPTFLSVVITKQSTLDLKK